MLKAPEPGILRKGVPRAASSGEEVKQGRGERVQLYLLLVLTPGSILTCKSLCHKHPPFGAALAQGLPQLPSPAPYPLGHPCSPCLIPWPPWAGSSDLGSRSLHLEGEDVREEVSDLASPGLKASLPWLWSGAGGGWQHKGDLGRLSGEQLSATCRLCPASLLLKLGQLHLLAQLSQCSNESKAVTATLGLPAEMRWAPFLLPLPPSSGPDKILSSRLCSLS